MIQGLLLSLLLFFQASGVPDTLKDTRAALDRGDLAAAEREVLEVLKDAPRSAEGHFILGGIRSRQRRFEEAATLFKKTIEIDPDFVEAYSVLDTLYQSLGRPDEALATVRQGVTRLPQNAELRYLLARNYLLRKDFETALTHLEQIPEGERPARFWETLGQCYLLSERLEDAKVAFGKFLDLDNDSVRTLQTLAAINLRTGDTSAAWDFIARARRIAPNSPQILYDFAHLSMIENLVGEAAAALQYLLLMEPDNPDAQFRLGSAFIHFSNFGRSQQLFSSYIRTRPEDPQGHAMLGYSLYLGSKFNEARPHLEKALQLDPKLTEAIFYLAMIDYSLGNDEQAEQQLKKVLELSKNHGRSHLNLGKLYFRQRKLEEARTHLERAGELLPSDFETHFQLSRIYSTLGDSERAQKELELFESLREQKDEREKEARRTPYSDFGRKEGN